MIFAKGGVIHTYALRHQLDSTVEAVQQIEADNERMHQVIQEIQSDPDIARSQLAKSALVAPPGSVIYRFKDVTKEYPSLVDDLSLYPQWLSGYVHKLEDWWRD